MITFTNYAEAVLHQVKHGGKFVTISVIKGTDCYQLHIWTANTLIVDVYNKNSEDTELYHSSVKANQGAQV